MADEQKDDKQKEAEAWSRPVAQQKDAHLRSWLLFFGFLLLAFALWMPIRMFWTRKLYVTAEHSLIRDSAVFEVLAYSGVSEDAVLPNSQDVTPLQFEQQMAELSKRGYHAISLQDVVDFYKEKKLLPRKSILLTFEQTRKSSYFEVRDILKKYRWKAVMGVWTKPLHTKDAQSLLWPYLQDMQAFGLWDLASQSSQGFDFIPAGPEGQTAPFFSIPKWLPEVQRYEVPEEFALRVAEDHQAVTNEFFKELGTRPVAFFYPYGDYGQYDENAHVVREINLREAGKVYSLGFTLGALPLNTQYSDPKRLTRLLVDKTMSASQLVDHLDRFWPITGETGSKRAIHCDAAYWISEWGSVERTEDNELRVRAVPPEDPVNITLGRTATTGAKAWLAGSDLFMNGYVSMRFQLRHGRYSLYLRSTAKGEYVCFTLDPLGNVTFRQRMSTGEEFILAMDAAITENDTTRSDYELLVGLRGNVAYVRLNNKLLFNGPITINGEPQSGMVGVGVWDEVVGIGDVRIAETRIIEPEKTLVTWLPEIVRQSAHFATWMHENCYRYTIIAPPWLDIHASASMMLPKWDENVIRMMTKINRCTVYPQMMVMDAMYLLRVPPESVASDIGQIECDGLYVNAMQCPVDQMVQLSSWLLKVNELLRRKNRKLMLRLPPGAEKMPSSGNMINQLGDFVLVGDFKEPPFDLPWNRICRSISVAPEDGSGPLTLYYQLASFKEGEDLSPDAKIEMLRQNGFDAFTVGDYNAAIKAWRAWSAIEPRRSEPYALIGDAYIRLNALDNALESYTKSLDMNPGQMDLAVRRARLLERMGRADEQAEMLDLYARTFPGTAAIIIEQAKWLAANKQHGAACKILRELVAAYPEDIESRTVLQSILVDPQERYENLKGLVSLISGGETSVYSIGKVLANSDLMTLRESSIFFEVIRDMAKTAFSTKVKSLFASFLPLDRIIDEAFVEGRPSNDWILFGNVLKTKSKVSDRFELRASSEMAEAYLRLKRSDLMRDGVMEVELDESVGFFWLYARRSSGTMVRFGFDEEGFLRIQAWSGGNIAASESRVWIRPTGILKIGLIIRGDGAYGLINGKQMFTTPLSIPNELRYGWWGVAPFSSELGLARAKINRITVAPTPATILMVPEMEEDETREFLTHVGASAVQISALAPIAYRQLQNGDFEENAAFKRQTLRMFAAFHRMRYMPIIDSSYTSEPDIDRLMRIVEEDAKTSYGVCMRESPSQAWMDTLAKRLEKTNASLLIFVSPIPFWTTYEPGKTASSWLEQKPVVTVRQIERGNVLVAPLDNVWYDLPVNRFEGVLPNLVPLEDHAAIKKLASGVETPILNTPRIYLYPARGILRKPFKMDPVDAELKPETIEPLAKEVL